MEDNRYDIFENYCKSLRVLDNFKKNQNIISIIENVSRDYGFKYLDNIKIYEKNMQLNWNTIKTLNDIGSPHALSYYLNSSITSLSPTTLRYVQFSLDMLTHMKNKKCQDVSVYEVGGGYGFQAVLLTEMAKLFDIKVNKYTIIDLPGISNMQNLFIKESSKRLNHNFTDSITTFNPSDIDSITVPENAFFVSNYAVGELKKEWQNFYVDKLISKCAHGFICWNFSVGNQKIHEYFDTIEKEVVEENPQTNCHPVKSYNVMF